MPITADTLKSTDPISLRDDVHRLFDRAIQLSSVSGWRQHEDVANEIEQFSATLSWNTPYNSVSSVRNAINYVNSLLGEVMTTLVDVNALVGTRLDEVPVEPPLKLR